MQDVTEGCDVVMYTMSLGSDIKEMTLEIEFLDGEAQEEWKESTVCTLAFVLSESRPVKYVIDQVPPNSLDDQCISQRSDHKTKVEHLNGYLAGRHSPSLFSKVSNLTLWVSLSPVIAEMKWQEGTARQERI